MATISFRRLCIVAASLGSLASPSAPARAATNDVHPVWRPFAPPARAKGALVLDTRRRRLIRLGGEGCAAPKRLETWQAPLDSLWAASPLPTAGLGPLPPIAAAAYDSAADRVLLVAGADANEAWQLAFAGGAPTWSALPTGAPSPPPRIDPAIAFDSIRNRFIVVGGAAPGANDALTDVWILDTSPAPAWRAIQPAGEPAAPTAQATLSYDPANDRCLLFGGGSTALWSLDLSPAPSWSQIAAAGSGPPSWRGGVAWYDSPNGRLLVRGGVDDTSSPPDSATWEFRFGGTLAGAWQRLTESGARPTLGWKPVSVCDRLGSRWIVSGGIGYGAFGCQALGDLRALRLDGPAQWDDLLPGVSQPLEHFGMRALLDEKRSRIVLVPGAARLNSARAGPTLSAPLVRPLFWGASASPTEPGHRIDGVAVVDTLGDRILFFGGFGVSGEIPDNAVWSYSLATDTWGLLAVGGEAPASRGAAAAVLDPFHRRMLVFGGLVAAPDGSYAETNELWSLDLSSPPSWRLIASPIGPGPRERSAMVLDGRRHRALLLDGRSDERPIGEAWALDLDSLRWSGPAAGAQPSDLSGKLVFASPDEDALYAIGLDGPFSVSRCDLATLTWRDLQAVGGPPSGAADRSTGVFDARRRRIVVFDGGDAAPEPWSVDLAAAGQLAIDVLGTRIDTLARKATIWWATRDFAVRTAALERRIDGGAWQDLGAVRAEDRGVFTLVETSLAPRARYEFRLRCADGAGSSLTGATSFVAPGAAPAGVRVFPNPASRDLTLRYLLPGDAPGLDRIELFDLSGRKVLERRLSEGGHPDGALTLSPPAGLRSGVYFVQLSSGPLVVASARVVMLQ